MGGNFGNGVSSDRHHSPKPRLMPCYQSKGEDTDKEKSEGAVHGCTLCIFAIIDL